MGHWTKRRLKENGKTSKEKGKAVVVRYSV
jgi:hypothetical protein